MLPFTNQHDSASAILSILNGERVTLRYPCIITSSINFMSGFLFRLLARLDLGFVSELILVVIKELATNASKAALKRIYFREQGRDLNNPDEYARTIKSFSHDVLAHWDDYRQKYIRTEYYIDISLQRQGENLILEIESNTSLLPQERERIQARFEKFNKYTSLNRSFDEIRDPSEGAGLGIVMSLMFLKNIGVPTENLVIESESGRTVNRIIIPVSLKPFELKMKFRDEILAETEALPSLPENITRLMELCNSDTVSVNIIGDGISRDPALTAQLLKLVNSAGYIQRIRRPSITDAVKIIGLKVIRNLLLVSGARNVMNSRYQVRGLGKIWEGSNRVSFYARRLSTGRYPAMLIDNAALAGLLFELGKIILLSFDPKMVRRTQELMGAGRIRNSSVIEEVGLGISHPEIGATIANRWNFPEPLIAAIRFQQKPLQAPPEYQDLVHVVYMAIHIYQAEVQSSDYFAVEPDILEKFSIHSSEQFYDLVGQLSSQYLEGEQSAH